ncbi:MAG: SRPBCC family protein [Chryseosolibacter sp.]
MEKTKITVEATVNSPVEKVWEVWSNPKHITQWCAASDDWHAPYAENDLRRDGRFKTTMAAKDGSMAFDFEGVYSDVVPHKKIEYAMADGRTVQVTFAPMGNQTKVTETFDAENTHPVEVQRDGWQAILNNFKAHTENS